ncbi:MAG TPA: hypothetical protein VF432_17320 [Thermoanaerobaculia bacterium]
MGAGPRAELFVNPADTRVVLFVEPRSQTVVIAHGVKDARGAVERLTLVESAAGQLALRADGQPGLFQAPDGTVVRFDFSAEPVRLLLSAADGREYEVSNGKMTILDADPAQPERITEGAAAGTVGTAGETGLSGTVTRLCEGRPMPVSGATVFGRYYLRGGTTCPSPSFTARTGADGRFTVAPPVNSASSDTLSLICDSLPDAAERVCEWVPPDLDIEAQLLAGCQGFLAVPPPYGPALYAACTGAVVSWTAVCNLGDACDVYQTLANDFYARNCTVDGSLAVISASHPDFGTVTPPAMTIPADVSLVLPKPSCENAIERHTLGGEFTQDSTWRTVAYCEGRLTADQGGSDSMTLRWDPSSMGKKLNGEWIRGTCKREETSPDGTRFISWSYTYDYPAFSYTIQSRNRGPNGFDENGVTHHYHIPSGTLRGTAYTRIEAQTQDCAERGTHGSYTTTATYVRYGRLTNGIVPLGPIYATPEKGVCESDWTWIPH